MPSSTDCSSTLATKRSVEAICWASTARHRRRVARLASESTACGVQILDDTNQPFCAANQLDRTTRQPAVFPIEPASGRRVVGTDHGIQRTKQAHEQGAELPLLLLVIERIGAVRHARDGRGAQAQDLREA